MSFTVRMMWVRQMKSQHDAGKIDHVPRSRQGARALELTPFEIQKITHLRRIKTSWGDITALRHYNESPQRVRAALMRQTGTELPKRRSKLLAAPTEEQQQEEVDRMDKENDGN